MGRDGSTEFLFDNNLSYDIIMDNNKLKGRVKKSRGTERNF